MNNRKVLLVKIFKGITDNNNLPQPCQELQTKDIQEAEIKMSINLLYDEGTNEKPQHLLKSYKIKSIFYTCLYFIN